MNNLNPIVVVLYEMYSFTPLILGQIGEVWRNRPIDLDYSCFRPLPTPVLPRLAWPTPLTVWLAFCRKWWLKWCCNFNSSVRANYLASCVGCSPGRPETTRSASRQVAPVPPFRGSTPTLKHRQTSKQTKHSPHITIIQPKWYILMLIYIIRWRVDEFYSRLSFHYMLVRLYYVLATYYHCASMHICKYSPVGERRIIKLHLKSFGKENDLHNLAH